MSFLQLLWNEGVLVRALCKFVARSSTGAHYLQVLQYDVVLDVLCASFAHFAERSTTLCSTKYHTLWYEVVLGSTFCMFCRTGLCWEVLCAKFAVRSGTGTCFLQAWCEVVLGRTFCKFCGTKQYWDVLCVSFLLRSSTGMRFKYCSKKSPWDALFARFVAQSGTGTYFVEAL